MKPTTLKAVQKDFRALGNEIIAVQTKRFFKTGEGEYGYGDQFLGIRVPVIRQVSKEHGDLPRSVLHSLVQSSYHEERLLGLLVLVNQYQKASTEAEKQAIYAYYVQQFSYINNWDLVDVTCRPIIGQHLLQRDRSVLYTWARSSHIWTRRIAVVTTEWFMRHGDCEEVLRVSELLLEDKHDLIHKAVGWMLREAWKRAPISTEAFLKTHYPKLPRTTLRYAIERFPEKKERPIYREC